ncbi:MAG: molybdopterin guanine dinucleotide-containing S/N-oxide reductase [Hyphomicrobiaceae bacterium]
MSNHEDLPLTSTHWGTYRVETREGKVTALHSFERDPDPSPIGQGIVDVLDGPTRITSPMVRKSWLEKGPGAKTEKRGCEAFVSVSWERAEQLVAEELDRVRREFGNESIFAGSYGWSSAGRFHHAQSQLHRFLNCIGGYTRSVNTYSFAAAEVVVPHVLGSYRDYVYVATSWRSIVENSDLFVAFGGVPLKNGQIGQGGVGQHCQRESVLRAAEAGVSFVNVSPLRSDVLDDVNGQWLAARPSTDTAILLAIAHTLFTERLHDQTFLDHYTIGFEKFSAYLIGETDGIEKDANWAAQISEISADAIRNLARRMASSRTMISVSWSLTRQDHGEQTFWSAITVAAMLGQIGLPGGGIGFGYSAVNTIGRDVTSLPAAAFPQGQNPVDKFIPVARIADMLLNPGAPFDYNGQQHTYPDARIVYWAGGNPFHHHQDLNRLLQAWRKPETVIVHEWCWNALAKHADIVLPCTTSLERTDLALTSRDPYLVYMEQASKPAGESRNDYDIFRGIARRMGVDDDFSEGRDDTDWIRWIYDQTRQRAAQSRLELPSLKDLRQKRWFKIDGTGEPNIMLKSFRDDPIANPLKTPSGKIEIYSQTIAQFGYNDCPGHPTWMEPVEWLGLDNKPFPLHLISNQPTTKLHSQLDHGSHSRAAKINGREPIKLHPDDAKSRKIETGHLVRVFNDRGACLCAAVIDDQIRPGVAQMSTGAWFDPTDPEKSDRLCKHGNANVLTKDKGTSRLAQGPIAHSCLVEVERYVASPPVVTAFDPPEILKETNR